MDSRVAVPHGTLRDYQLDVRLPIPLFPTFPQSSSMASTHAFVASSHFLIPDVCTTGSTGRT